VRGLLADHSYGHPMLLDIHGLTLRCETTSPALAADLVRPFKFFVREQIDCDVTIDVTEEAPPYDTVPPIEAQFSTPRNVVYRNGEHKVIDYFGRGAIFQRSGEPRYRLYSCDRNLLREAFYLLVTSLFGQYCDRNGLLRVHALAISCRGRALLLLIPQGGGKSTMSMSLLEQDAAIRLISDDDPIVARDGRILPFPKALGFLDRRRIEHVPAEYVYAIDRMEFGRKYFVDYDYWRDRIEDQPLDRSLLFVTRRVLNGTPAIVRASRAAAIKALMRDAVIGVGLYQGVEFLFNHTTWEAVAKGALVWRRFLRAVSLARRSEVYQFTLSTDVARNCEVLESFIGTLE
jgi:hypothetical protein